MFKVLEIEVADRATKLECEKLRIDLERTTKVAAQCAGKATELDKLLSTTTNEFKDKNELS